MGHNHQEQKWGKRAKFSIKNMQQLLTYLIKELKSVYRSIQIVATRTGKILEFFFLDITTIFSTNKGYINCFIEAQLFTQYLRKGVASRGFYLSVQGRV